MHEYSTVHYCIVEQRVHERGQVFRYVHYQPTMESMLVHVMQGQGTKQLIRR